MEHQNRIWELLAKRLSGELEPGEQEALNALLKEEKEDINYMMDVMENYFSSIQRAPESADVLQTTCQHKEALTEDVKKEKNQEARSSGMRMLFKHRKKWIWVAAAFLFLAGGWFILHLHNSPSSPMNVVTTRNGTKTKIVLPDGTEVWLNAGTTLTYPNNFKEARQREVSLSGEAYFKVTHDVLHSFIIHTKYLNIKDLGTAFNVRAYPDEEKSEATLIEGSITVSLKEDPGKKLHLKPGEKIMYFASNHQLVTAKEVEQKAAPVKIKPLTHPQRLEVTHIQRVVVRPGDTVVSETAWLNDQLIFNNETFSELARRMSRYYNVNIIIKNEAVKNYSFTGIFEGESLQQALKELQMIRPFTFKINKNKIIINK